MDTLAFNYNPAANSQAIGSCIPVMYGCMNAAAFNFNHTANADDGSCVPVVRGCTDSRAWEYTLDANTDDGSCTSIERMDCAAVGDPMCCSFMAELLTSVRPTLALAASLRDNLMCEARMGVFLYALHCTDAFWATPNEFNACDDFCTSTFTS